MTNTKAIAFLAILVILATAIWRVATGRASNNYRTVWAAGLVAIGLSVITDLNSGTGAAISFTVLLFFLIRLYGQTKNTPAGTFKLPTPNGSGAIAPSQPAPSSGGSGSTAGGSGGCPPGWTMSGGKCVNIA